MSKSPSRWSSQRGSSSEPRPDFKRHCNIAIVVVVYRNVRSRLLDGVMGEVAAVPLQSDFGWASRNPEAELPWTYFFLLRPLVGI